MRAEFLHETTLYCGNVLLCPWVCPYPLAVILERLTLQKRPRFWLSKLAMGERWGGLAEPPTSSPPAERDSARGAASILRCPAHQCEAARVEGRRVATWNHLLKPSLVLDVACHGSLERAVHVRRQPSLYAHWPDSSAQPTSLFLGSEQCVSLSQMAKD